MHFISQQELDEKYRGFPHDGLAIAVGSTGDGNGARVEYRCVWGSNPEATANVLVAHARAAVRLAKEGRTGAFTILDIPGGLFHDAFARGTSEALDVIASFRRPAGEAGRKISIFLRIFFCKTGKSAL